MPTKTVFVLQAFEARGRTKQLVPLPKTEDRSEECARR